MTVQNGRMNDLYIRSVSIDWQRIDGDSYLRRIEALDGVERVDFIRPITFFVGENGSGKSTLLEAIAIAADFNPEGGTRNYRFSTRDSHSPLCDALRLVRGTRRADWGCFLRAESFYNVATQEESYADAQILSFDGGRIHPCAYEDTDSYQVTRMFTENRELLLKRLLEGEEGRN